MYLQYYPGNHCAHSRIRYSVRMTQRITAAIEIIRGALRSFTDSERCEILVAVSATDKNEPASERKTLDVAVIQNALAVSGSNVEAAAASLGVSRRTLQNYMRKLKMPYGRSGRKSMLVAPDEP